MAKNSILVDIEHIYNTAEGSNLSKDMFSKIRPQMKRLAEFFKITPMQAFWTAIVFASAVESTVTMQGIAEYLKCKTLSLLYYHSDLEHLKQVGLIYKIRKYHTEYKYAYKIPEKIKLAVLSATPLTTDDGHREDLIDIIGKIKNLTEDVKSDDIDPCMLRLEFCKTVDANHHIPLLKHISELSELYAETYLFLMVCWDFLMGRTVMDLDVLKFFFEEESDRIRYMQDIINGKNVLIRNNLLRVVEAEFGDDVEVGLSAYGLQLLSKENIRSIVNKGKTTISPLEIKEKQLFFNPKEKKQLAMLTQSLDETNFQTLRNRLSEKAYPAGITVLLYGESGTGKTEAVYQLAKQTGREIMHIDISQSKSMWFGKSEKVIKRIFTDYHNYKCDTERCPILFFNEADAIISKRRDVLLSNTGQTENSMQNIILEELERFDGILIATTNLVNNFDTAFERRFLFKIQFTKPDTQIAAAIWQSKLDALGNEEYRSLAEKFDFSGGQIDNVVRKVEMTEIFTGNKPNIDEIIEFCREERLQNSANKVGFY